ncbi:MAG TPA: SDR family NAD(P)-dependent oxidoreductase, partial [Candidatus Elarobacter sp.]|nr:SDR family NAD(P)-dependent oxidoreductase [Candidatus Elarobacter sp.]
PAAIFAELRAHLPQPAAGDDYAALARFEEDAETFAEHAVLHALRALKPGLANGTHFPAGDPCAALGVVPEHRRLLERGLRHLTDRGVAQRDATGWTIVRDVPRYDLEAEIAALRVAYPGSKPEIDVAARTVELPRVLRGEISGVDVLFPNGSFELANALYRETPSARLMNALVAQVMRGVSAPAQRALRVLEIGAGTGGTTASVLASLPVDTEYVFTDLSAGFFATARLAFRQYPNLRYEVLDVENRARVDELAAEPFDVVIAANVLHATASIRDTLANARALLRDGGSLVLLEATMSLAIADVTFGATEGWSKRADMELRPFGPLLTRELWVDVLTEAGFEAATLPVLPEFGVVTEQHTIVVARRTDTRATRSSDAVIVHRGELPIEARVAFARAGITATAHELSDDASVAALAAVLAQRRPSALVFLGPDERRDDAADEVAQRALGDLLDVAQLCVNRPEKLALWIVTAGAQPAFGERVRPAGGALWGFARVLASEYPNVGSYLIDLTPAAPIADWDRLAGFVADGATERECALRNGELRVPRLAPAGLRAAGDGGVSIAADGCYVVTGAFGALGLLTSRWLAQRGAGTLVLNGRREPGTEAQAIVDAARAAGTRVEIVVADIGTPEGIDAVLERAGASGHRLRGIVHSAAALDDAAIPQQTRGTLAEAFDPKARAAWMLHQRTLAAKLDFFALYSSTAALIGSRGQANYAGANGFLDALAHHRRSLGLACTSVNWGLWEQSGAAVKRDQLEAWTARGVVPIGPEEGLEALARGLAANEP